MRAHLSLIVSLVALSRVTGFSAAFMDIAVGTFTPGTANLIPTWTGTLAGVGVSGSFSAAPPDTNTTLEIAAPGIGFSTLDNTSPQWSHPTVYAEISPLDDRIGYSQVPGPDGFVSILFATPMSNLIFHVANLDATFLDFTPSVGGGLTGLSLLSGNGGAGDGIGVGGLSIFDAAPLTTDGTPPGVAPPLIGLRSAYGSVRLNGTYLSLDFKIVHASPGIENANFTLSTPEPGAFSLTALGVVGIILHRRRRV